MSVTRHRHRKIVLVEEGYLAVERLLAYEVGRHVLGVPLAMQQRFGLRAEPFQILLLIMLASVQRYVRATPPDPGYLDRTSLPDALSGGVSRRRIAEALNIPVETVRRQVQDLIQRGHVIEPRRGHLTTPAGILQLLAVEKIPQSAAAESIALINLMLMHGAARLEE